jgi:hypothetical protein
MFRCSCAGKAAAAYCCSACRYVSAQSGHASGASTSTCTVQKHSEIAEQHLLQMLLPLSVLLRLLQALTVCTYILHNTLLLHNTTLMHAATTHCRTGVPSEMVTISVTAV